MIIGIDLGTTHSVVATMTPDGPKIIPNALGHSLTPSVVAFEPGGTVLVGAAAREYQVTAPERCASLFKRHMGSDYAFTLEGESYSPEQLSAIVLKSLKEDAQAFLQTEVEEAVITVPAYFNEHQRKATIQAGELAGLKVNRIINEPTAAAIAYGLHEDGEEKIVAVFDLGGGTFDISIVDMFEGAVEVRASAGESFLGGEDFTRTMAARVLQSQSIMFEHAELESPARVSRLLQFCEQAKKKLSQEASATIRLPEKDGDIADESPTIEISRTQFEEWTDSILNRVEPPIRRCLGDARIRREDINEVILVGGATRMPNITQRVGEFFQQPPHSRINPDEVVALGAAVQAGLMGEDESLEDMVVTDVAPFTLGVEVAKRIGNNDRAGYFNPIISRNTTIPISRVERFSTMRANQNEILIKVYQGESRRVEDNMLLGELAVRGIPRGPSGQPIDIRFSYDLNGVLEVEAIIVATQQKTRLVIAKHARGMSETQIAQAVEKMQSMKTHPREEAGNRFLLKRAERIYRELNQFEREHLNELVDQFEAAIEMQEPQAIDQQRQILEAFLEQFDDETF